MEKEIEKVASELLELLGVKASVFVNKESEVLVVEIKPEGETGLLIGHKGETLSAIEMFLAMVVKQRTGEWVRISVNIGDWKDKQEDYLRKLAEDTVMRALETGEPQPLYNLTPTQRRTIHLFVSERTDAESESTGEGRDRYLIVKPKK